ncbi:MAG TPA: FAD-dependent oxidoreductase, partial [Rhizomicrobium sp.]|nr:FAD-dependent oxidoreductase [Rhizomicrobium sp.]
GLHRNTFINSPRLLDAQLRLRLRPDLRFAGQMTGVEGYVESAAIGLLAGRFAAADILSHAIAPPPPTTAFGALLAHITGGADAKTFQPMNVNFGLIPEPPAHTRGKDRKRAQAHRAIDDLRTWLQTSRAAAE